MKLNRNGLLAKYWLWMGDGDSLPGDFCKFFWGMVWRLSLCSIAAFCAIGILIFLLAVGVTGWHHKRITALVLTGAVTGALIVWRRRQLLKFQVVREVLLVSSTKIESIKENYCPRIQWEGDDS